MQRKFGVVTQYGQAMPSPALSELTDEEIVNRVKAGEIALYEALMRRYNQRLFRVARSILRDDAEAEDTIQDAYVRAYEHLDSFAGAAKFSTWLTKIAAYESLRRLRRRAKTGDLDSVMDTATAATPSPERQAYDQELRTTLERAIDRLPDAYRSVFVLRVVEGLDVADTATALDVGLEAVKTRLHRARAMLRRDLQKRSGIEAMGAFSFHAVRCDRVVAGVFSRIQSRTLARST
jgi:RNA polymerase sigma-70 factor, ECF subfamily